MGYNTTVLISNNGWNEVIKEEDIMKNIHKASHRGGTVSAGSFANPVLVKKTRHADDRTVYVYAGNTLVDACPFGDDMKNLLSDHPKFFEECLQQLQYTTRKLEKMKSNHKRFKKVRIKKVRINKATKPSSNDLHFWYRNNIGDEFLVERTSWGDKSGIEGIQKYRLDQLWKVREGEMKGSLILKEDCEEI